ncbi:MAG: hypothetical protein P4N59_02210 [Negativicutes bacterium]|nr:hypothetical protein [Negativicutes bacterium]
MWDDSKALLDFASSKLRPVELFKKGDILKTLRVVDGKTDSVMLVIGSNLIVPVSDEDLDQFTTAIDAPGRMEAPITAGEKIGSVRVLYRNREIDKIDLIAAENVERKSFFRLIWTSVLSIVNSIVGGFS